jgi:CheY-like chemotaxis protein
VAVSDSGIGIPREILPRIFDPFFTTKQQGSGLGLATAYSIIKKHDGHVFADSEPGRGSTFTFYLPAVEGDAHASPAVSVSAMGNRRGRRVLILDDEVFIRQLAESSLKSRGFTVTVAADGAQALELFVSARAIGQPFDLAILDLTIPGGMGGAAVVEQMDAIGSAVRAIASSGYADDPIMASPQAHGFAASLPKPYTKDELLSVIDRVLPEQE